MKPRDIWTVALTGISAIGAGTLVYGALVESKRLVIDQYKIPLKKWPQSLGGFRIAVLADFHVRDSYSQELSRRAIAAAIEARPDMMVLLGDFVGNWKPESPAMLGQLLEPLRPLADRVLAIPGNHEYREGDASFLGMVLAEIGIPLLRNESRLRSGIRWVGVDSYNAGKSDVAAAFDGSSGPEPVICLWHEPDVVDLLPKGGADLMLSGHSHGGQYRLPFGIVPMTSRNGKRYRDGFYPDASTPIFVTRGVGTTGPPSRFGCPPQVAILTITRAD